MEINNSEYENLLLKIDKEALLYLLKIIDKKNGNLAPVVNMGYTYKQILEIINQLENLEYIKKLDNGNPVYSLMEKGKDLVNYLNENLNRNNIELFIEPLSEFKIPGISKNDIFVPSPYELPKVNLD